MKMKLLTYLYRVIIEFFVSKIELPRYFIAVVLFEAKYYNIKVQSLVAQMLQQCNRLISVSKKKVYSSHFGQLCAYLSKGSPVLHK